MSVTFRYQNESEWYMFIGNKINFPFQTQVLTRLVQSLGVPMVNVLVRSLYAMEMMIVVTKVMNQINSNVVGQRSRFLH